MNALVAWTSNAPQEATTSCACVSKRGDIARAALVLDGTRKQSPSRKPRWP